MRTIISGIALMVLLSGNALALGLGTISPQSGLNQAFLAYIPINSANQDELDTLQISLADRIQFKQTGTPRPFILAHLKFTVITGDQGKPFVKIYSNETIQEPFLEFLVEYHWNRGKLLQKYTVLLDPVTPAEKQPVPTAPVRPATTVNIPQANERPSTDSHTLSDAAMEKQSAAVEKVTPSDAVLYGPVTATDTLWSIARDNRPDNSVSIQQMMLALLHTNPNAFSKPDVGSLIKGKMLRIPGLAEITQIDSKTARE